MSKSEPTDKQHAKQAARQSTTKTSTAKQPTAAAPTRRKQTTPATRHYLPADERRQRILDSSREVFARNGLQGARTRDLAQAAGINQATLFAHFASKEDLFAAAVLQPLAALFDGIRERYLWELVSPAENDPVYNTAPGQFRSELHDRIMAPLYPFAFAALTFAFLGAPRTTRQSRNFSIGGSILAVFGLRMAGFACSVMAVKSPLAPPIQYAMLFAAIGGGMWMIIAGVVVEPPPALLEAINRSNARIARLFGRPVPA